MKKNVGMTIAQKSKETRVYVHFNLKLPDIYVGIVGWMYRTKSDPISTPYPCFLTFLSNEMFFPLLI